MIAIVEQYKKQRKITVPPYPVRPIVVPHHEVQTMLLRIEILAGHLKNYEEQALAGLAEKKRKTGKILLQQKIAEPLTNLKQSLGHWPPDIEDILQKEHALQKGVVEFFAPRTHNSFLDKKEDGAAHQLHGDWNRRMLPPLSCIARCATSLRFAMENCGLQSVAAPAP
jgi:hypothetical protein